LNHAVETGFHERVHCVPEKKMVEITVKASGTKIS
jgi:hypothetical protein